MTTVAELVEHLQKYVPGDYVVTIQERPFALEAMKEQQGRVLDLRPVKETLAKW